MQFLENYIVHRSEKFNEAQVQETEENEIKMHFIIKLLKTSNRETCLKAHQKDSHIHGETKGRISLSGKTHVEKIVDLYYWF